MNAELKKRKKSWKKPAPRYPRGVLAKYAHTVTSAWLGAVTDADLKLGLLTPSVVASLQRWAE